VFSLILILLAAQIIAFRAGFFKLQNTTFDPSPTPSISIKSINRNAGYLKINEFDFGIISFPFTWVWGDGAIKSGWFPKEHTYTELSQKWLGHVFFSDGSRYLNTRWIIIN
jgi:hypothetical protein